MSENRFAVFGQELGPVKQERVNAPAGFRAGAQPFESIVPQSRAGGDCFL